MGKPAVGSRVAAVPMPVPARSSNSPSAQGLGPGRSESPQKRDAAGPSSCPGTARAEFRDARGSSGRESNAR